MNTEKIEPFRVEVPVEVLADLRARLSSTRFPDEVPDTGWEYGTNLAYLKELIEYWRTKYNWRAQEREINRFAQYKANFDGLQKFLACVQTLTGERRLLRLVYLARK